MTNLIGQVTSILITGTALVIEKKNRGGRTIFFDEREKLNSFYKKQRYFDRNFFKDFISRQAFFCEAGSRIVS